MSMSSPPTPREKDPAAEPQPEEDEEQGPSESGGQEQNEEGETGDKVSTSPFCFVFEFRSNSLFSDVQDQESSSYEDYSDDDDDSEVLELPSAEKQKEYYTQLQEESEMKVGDRWYLIHYRWWSQWKGYTGVSVSFLIVVFSLFLTIITSTKNHPTVTTTILASLTVMSHLRPLITQTFLHPLVTSEGSPYFI